MTRAVIGIDIGTTTVKCVVMTEHGDVIGGETSTQLAMTSERSGWAVQDPTELIRSTHEVVRRAAASIGPSIEVEALSIAAQSGSVVAIDDHGQPLTGLITWMDTRSAGIVDRWIDDGTADLVREISGWEARPGLGLTSMAWLAEHESTVMSSSARFASADDLVVHSLTGSWTTNTSNASGMQLMSIRDSNWSQELCDLVGIDPTRLSDIVEPGVTVGQLRPDIAERLGLTSGAVVVAGGHDQACTALALGLTEPGQVLLATGTAWVLTAVLPDGNIDQSPTGMNSSRHVAPGRTTASRYLGGFGANLQWCSSLSPDEPEKPDQDSLVGDPVVTFEATGADGHGVSTPGAGIFVGDTAAATHNDRLRAVMVAAASEVSSTLNELDTTRKLTMIGGATRSQMWPQIVADTTGREVHVVHDKTLPGMAAAIMAGVGVGIFTDIDEAIAAIRIESVVVSPRTHPTTPGDRSP